MKKVNVFRRLSLVFLACESILFMLNSDNAVEVIVWGLLFVGALASTAVCTESVWINTEHPYVHFIAAILFAVCGTLGLYFAYLMQEDPIYLAAECCFAATCFCWAFEDWYRWIEAHLAKIDPSE